MAYELLPRTRAPVTQKDQEQAIDFPRFRFRNAGKSRRDRAKRQEFPAFPAPRKADRTEICSCYVRFKASPENWRSSIIGAVKLSVG